MEIPATHNRGQAMKKWLLIALGLVLLSGCATFKNWLSTQDAVKVAEELKLIEQLLNQQQGSLNAEVPFDLGNELSKMKFPAPK